MIDCTQAFRFLLVSTLLSWLAFSQAVAGEVETSGFGAVAIPQPHKPEHASACVEPRDIIRREHMHLLLQQRDATVLNGERDGKYSLAGCMDCHNPAASTETAIHYPDPQHFCAGCHLYASVKIDCFECHADRGMAKIKQGRLEDPGVAQPGSGLLSLQTFQIQRGDPGGD